MMGALFYRRVPTSEIESMSFTKMKYWYSWHKKLNKEQENQLKKIEGDK